MAHDNSNTTFQEASTLLPTDPDSFELRVFDPKQITLVRVAGVTRMTWQDNRCWIKVSAARAFPLSNPDHYVGFLDGAGKDIGVVAEPALMDPESKRIIEQELEKRYFVPLIEKVLSVKEEFGAVYWKVVTDRGNKEITVRNLRDNLQELSSTRVLVTDVDGNRFEFPDLGKLDYRSMGIIMRNL